MKSFCVDFPGKKNIIIGLWASIFLKHLRCEMFNCNDNMNAILILNHLLYLAEQPVVLSVEIYNIVVLNLYVRKISLFSRRLSLIPIVIEVSFLVYSTRYCGKSRYFLCNIVHFTLLALSVFVGTFVESLQWYCFCYLLQFFGCNYAWIDVVVRWSMVLNKTDIVNSF